ncbi:MAG: PilZ domain-containing protein [Sulfuricaulis sp.]|nr:PilZ domain-containing protein [Sulfuricaulis sp.]
MQEKRRYERRPETLRMSVKPVVGQTKTYTTLDISHGGMFLMSQISEQVPVGTVVVISPARHLPGITPPAIKARVVRSNAEGMGIEFINESAS